MMKIKVQALIIVIICIVLSGCGKSSQNDTKTKNYNITVQGAIFGGSGDDRISGTVSFDPAWITVRDNTEYNRDLAGFAAVLSDDVYFRAKDLDRGTPNRVLYEGENAEEYDQTSFLKEIGFSEVEYIESYKAREYSCDSNDSVTLLLAHKLVDDKYDLYVIALRGCFSAQEWISAFDPGSTDESYSELTGQHSEWSDKYSYKGMDIAKNRAMEFIEEFIEKNDDPNCQNCMLITGHSRGGALANMIGAEMEDRDNIRSYTYAFNAPSVTVNEKAKEYTTIFNIFDSNDFLTDPLPFAREKFCRYGRDLSMAISDTDEIKTEITKLKGRDDFTNANTEFKSQFKKLFGQRFPDRASLYTMTSVTQTFDTEEDAMACADMYRTIIGSDGGLGVEEFCFLNGNTVNDEGKYEVSMSYCGGAVLIAYAKTLAYGASAYESAVKLFEGDREVCEILSLLMDNAADITGGHLLVNSFVLSQYVN